MLVRTKPIHILSPPFPNHPRPGVTDNTQGYGGVFENEPEKFENIARAGESKNDLPSGISAKERREEFLRKANETSIVRKEPTKVG